MKRRLEMNRRSDSRRLAAGEVDGCDRGTHGSIDWALTRRSKRAVVWEKACAAHDLGAGQSQAVRPDKTALPDRRTA